MPRMRNSCWRRLPKPYLHGRAWKSKTDAWCASTYVFAGVFNAPTRAAALKRLRELPDEMEGCTVDECKAQHKKCRRR